MCPKPFKPKPYPNRTPSVVQRESSGVERKERGDISDYSYACGHFQDPDRQRQPEAQHNYYNMQELQEIKVRKQQQDSTLSGQDSDRTSESVIYACIMHTNNEDCYNSAQAADRGDGEDMVVEDNELYDTTGDAGTQQTADERENDTELVVAENELYFTT